LANIKSNKFRYINQAVNISDTHGGCQLALCPEVVPLDNGGVYRSSALQLKILAWWNEFWDEWVPRVTKGEPYAVVHNGDPIEGVHHKANTQISQNEADQAKVAEMILRPIKERAEGGFYMMRGTNAHGGESDQNTEKLAKSLGAIPQIIAEPSEDNPDGIKNYARNELWLRLGGPNGSLVHYLHHIGTSSALGYEATALTKEFEQSLVEAARWGYPAPDFVIRGHRHRHFKMEIATRNVYGIGEILPGWQLKTPLVWRIAGARLTTPQCGGTLVRKGDQEHYSVSKVWSVERTPEEIAIETPTVEG
jgi:hypothetical protein